MSASKSDTSPAATLRRRLVDAVSIYVLCETWLPLLRSEKLSTVVAAKLAGNATRIVHFNAIAGSCKRSSWSTPSSSEALEERFSGRGKFGMTVQHVDKCRQKAYRCEREQQRSPEFQICAQTPDFFCCCDRKKHNSCSNRDLGHFTSMKLRLCVFVFLQVYCYRPV